MEQVKNILFVKKQKVENRLISLSFGNQITKVTIVSDEKEAVNQLKFNDFEMIVLDSRLNVLKGKVFASVIANMDNSKYKSIPIYILNDNNEYEDLVTGKQADIKDVFEKLEKDISKLR